MKTVTLTKEEIEVITSALDMHKICEVICYCGYKLNLCDKIDKQGRPACRLNRVIQSIEEKLK